MELLSQGFDVTYKPGNKPVVAVFSEPYCNVASSKIGLTQPHYTLRHLGIRHMIYLNRFQNLCFFSFEKIGNSGTSPVIKIVDQSGLTAWKAITWVQKPAPVFDFKSVFNELLTISLDSFALVWVELNRPCWLSIFGISRSVHLVRR